MSAMHRAKLRVASERVCLTAEMRQKRGYLNMYPKPDANTMPEFTASQMYYDLPDYILHRDHKQVRSPKLDETNTSELTREQERIQRIKVMKHREELNRTRRKSSIAADDVPAWEPKAGSKGRFRRSWSGAQAVEYQLRNGVPPTALSVDDDLRAVDPFCLREDVGTLPLDQLLRKAKASFPKAPAHNVYFRQLIETRHFNDLSSRFQRLSNGVPLPATGLDFPEVVNLLSKGIVSKAASGGSAADAWRASAVWLHDLCAAVADGSKTDAFFHFLAKATAVECQGDWCSSTFNHQVVAGAELSDRSFNRMITELDQRGPRAFWEAAKSVPEFRPDFQLFLDSFLALSDGERTQALAAVTRHWDSVADVLEAQHADDVRSGTRPALYAATEAGMRELASDYLLMPFELWAETGLAAEAFASAGLTEARTAELAAAFDQKVAPNITLGEWLRWQVLGEYVAAAAVHRESAERAAADARDDKPAGGADDDVPDFSADLAFDSDAPAAEEAVQKVKKRPFAGPRLPAAFPHPSASLAARLKNLAFGSALRSIVADHTRQAPTAWAFHLNSPDTDAAADKQQSLASFVNGAAPVAFQFLRCLAAPGNIPGGNAARTDAFFLGNSAAALGTVAPGPLMVPGNDPVHALDWYAVAAECLKKDQGTRVWSTPEGAAEARDDARVTAMAVGYLQRLAGADFAAAAAERAAVINLARHAAEDVEYLIGHLRRTIGKRASRETVDPQDQNCPDYLMQNVTVAAHSPFAAGSQTGGGDALWICGTTRTVSWSWVPEAGYAVKVPTPEQKEAVFAKMLEGHRDEDEASQTPANLVADVMATVDSVSTEPDRYHEREDRFEWAFTRMYHKWKRERSIAEQKARVGVEGEYRVKLALYKRTDGRLRTLRERRRALKEFEAAAQASENDEMRRTVAIFDAVRESVVENYVSRHSHASGLSQAQHRLIQCVRSGEFHSMLESDAHLGEEEAEKSDSLWDYQFDLSEVSDVTFPNTGSVHVRLPFQRDGCAVGYETDATYCVGVTGLDKNGKSQTTAFSAPFRVSDTVDAVVDEYVTKGRSGKPPMGEALGRRVLLAAEETPSVANFIKNHRDGIELDLAWETDIGSDFFVAMRQGAAYPVLHLDVLKQSIRRDYHREEAAKDPMLAFAERNNALRKAVWHAMHPGASGTEWAEQRDAYLATEEPGWWTHDPDLTANWKPQSVADVNPASRYLDRKLCNLYTDDATPLASARYEGTGFVSKLTISPGARKVRVPLHEEPASADSKSVSVRAVAGDDIVVGLQDKSLVWRTGESDAFPVSEVAWSEIDNLLRLGDKHFELHPATSTETVLCRIRDLAREAGVPCTIPNQIPLGLHHLAAICKEVVNSAHTKHCFLAEALQRRYASGPCGNAFRVAEDEVHFLPTVLNAWEEAGSPAADSPPTGLAIQRRRFDSWQLNSGKGRYDYSPTKDEQWKHPIEENPVVYGFQDVQEPMSTL